MSSRLPADGAETHNASVTGPGHAAEAPGQTSRPPAGRWFRRQFVVARVVLLSLLLLVLVTHPLDFPTPAALTCAPGASFYAIGGPGTGIGLGQPAPAFGRANEPLVDLDGAPVTQDQLRGHPVWIVFWATWCPPCQQETPDIRATWDAYQASGLLIIAIDVQEPAQVVRDYARTYGLTYRIALDTLATTMRNYSVFGLPTHYFLDSHGIIRDRYFGPLTATAMSQRVEAIGATR